LSFVRQCDEGLFDVCAFNYKDDLFKDQVMVTKFTESI